MREYPSVEQLRNNYTCLHLGWLYDKEFPRSLILHFWSVVRHAVRAINMTPQQRTAVILDQEECVRRLRGLDGVNLLNLICTETTFGVERNYGSPLVCRQKQDKRGRWFVYGVLASTQQSTSIYVNVCPHLSIIKNKV